jgi:hypothetical protein
VLKKNRGKMIEITGKRIRENRTTRSVEYIYLYSLDYNRKKKEKKKSSTYVAHV